MLGLFGLLRREREAVLCATPPLGVIFEAGVSWWGDCGNRKLAVFRRLRAVQIVRDDGTLAGQPWGVVNCHPDKCDRDPSHLRVVWRQGTGLARATVEVAPSLGEFWPDEADCFLDSVVLRLASTGTTRFFRGEPPIDRWAYARDGVSIGKSTTSSCGRS